MAIGKSLILINLKIYNQFRRINTEALNGRDTDEILDAMNKDLTTCCQKQSRSRDGRSQRKRQRGVSDGSSGESSSTRSANSDRNKLKPLPKKVKLKVKNVAQLAETSKPPRAATAAPQAIEAMPDLSAFCTTELDDDTSAPSEEIGNTTDLFEFLSNRSQSMVGGEAQPEVPAPAVASPSTVPATAIPAPIVIQNVLSGNAAQQNINSMGTPSQNNSPQSSRQLGRPNTVTRVSSNTIRVNAAPSSEPVYHVINGYKIDLNSASQQNTIRLPNGKIIHVKKQPVMPNGQPARQPNQRSASRPAPGLNPNPLHARAHQAQMPVQRLPPPLVRQQVVRQQMPAQLVRPNRVRPTVQIPSAAAVLQSMQQMQQMRQMQPAPQQAQAMQPAQIQAQPTAAVHPALAAQQAKNLIVAAGPRKYHGGALGIARTQFERQIFNGLEICQLIENKLKTLMNSNAYKSVHSANDIKELQIHMSYLMTFTLGRFKTLQDKCMDDMRKLGFQSEADMLADGNVIKKYGSDNDEDDIEIVEPQHATIDLADSDDEQPKKTPDKSGQKKRTAVMPPAHLASAIAAARSLAISMRQSQPQATPITRVERASAVLPVERTPPATRAERSPSVAQDQVVRSIEIPEPEANVSVEDVECEADDIMALLQPQVIINDHDELELPMPPPLSPAPAIVVPDDPKLKRKAEVRLTKADDEFPELMRKLTEELVFARPKSDGRNAKSKNDTVEIESDENSANENTENADPDYEGAIHRLQELSSEICASPTAITNASAHEERIEVDEIVEINDSPIKTATNAEQMVSNERMDNDDTLSIVELNAETIPTADDASAKSAESVGGIEFSDCAHSTMESDSVAAEECVICVDATNPLEEECCGREEEGEGDDEEEIIQPSYREQETAITIEDESQGGEESEHSEAYKTIEQADPLEETDQGPDGIEHNETNDGGASAQCEKDNDDFQSDAILPKAVAIPSEANESNKDADDFENISSPDTFEDFSKNGVAGKINEAGIFDDAINDLICANISAIAD